MLRRGLAAKHLVWILAAATNRSGKYLCAPTTPQWGQRAHVERVPDALPRATWARDKGPPTKHTLHASSIQMGRTSSLWHACTRDQSSAVRKAPPTHARTLGRRLARRAFTTEALTTFSASLNPPPRGGEINTHAKSTAPARTHVSVHMLQSVTALMHDPGGGGESSPMCQRKAQFITSIVIVCGWCNNSPVLSHHSSALDCVHKRGAHSHYIRHTPLCRTLHLQRPSGKLTQHASKSTAAGIYQGILPVAVNARRRSKAGLGSK